MNTSNEQASVSSLTEYRRGFKAGTPVCLGYFGVGFAVSATAAAKAMPYWSQPLASLQCSGTSQGAIVNLYGEMGLLSILLTCIALNSRYILLSLAISQKLSPALSLAKRLLAALCITDEVVAIGILRKPLPFSYLFGCWNCAFIGWFLGAALGFIGSKILPASALAPLNIAIYAMFVAIVVPAAKASKILAGSVGVAVALNILLRVVIPAIPKEVILLLAGISAAAVGAYFKLKLDPSQNKEEAL